MRITTAGMLLTLAGLAMAAPVPKAKAPKMEDVFGEVTDDKSDCKFEMNQDGSLTMSLPAATQDLLYRRPVSKQIEGDFLLTVRITHTIPKGADGIQGLAPMVSAGIVCRCDTEQRIVMFTHRPHEEKGAWHNVWHAVVWHPQRLREGGGHVFTDTAVETTSFLRLTRRGAAFCCESSSDGEEWVKQYDLKWRELPATLSVGPAVDHTLDKGYTATFDQYEIKPLKDEKK